MIEQKGLSDQKIKEEIIEVGKRIYDKGFVASNDGNISYLNDDGTVWITPTGVSKGFMTEDILIKTDLNGEVLEGKYKPSSEGKMHYRIYRENPTIRAVVHTHALTATAFAIAGEALDYPVLPEAIVQLGVVPCTKFAMPGSTDVPDAIAEICKHYNAVLLGNHGAVTWGDSLMQAYYRTETLEYYAKITLLTKYVMGKANFLKEKEIDELVKIRTDMGVTRGGRPKRAD